VHILIDKLRWPTLLMAAASLAVLPGCATLTEGSAQTIRIDTDPPDARCELTRNGQLVTRIPATPATVSVYKEAGDLQLTCRKPGYLDATLDTASDFQDMVLGNILFGGLIGVAIDMGSGATSRYPEAITLTLVPERFASAAERDAYFDQLRTRLTRRAEAQMAKLRQTCEADNCEQQLARISAALDRQLAFLEKQQATTTISP
jgi:hypothetical protein